jgi:pimeloyl-ACP methyl ester carboxylesterase
MSVPADRFVALDGLRLHYLEWGRRGAPPLLLVHGGSAHAHWWDFLATALAGEYHVISVDLRGHGESGRPEPPAYALEDYVTDVEAVIRSCGWSRLAVVGHSMGALVAVAFASRGQVAVDALGLVDIRVRQSPGGRRYLERLALWPHPVYASRAEAIRRFRLLPSATAAAPEVLAHVADRGLRDLPGGRCTPKFDRAALSEAAIRDVSAELAALRCPILYVRGAHSTIVPARAMDEVRALAPQARLAEIPGAYHHVMLDNPPAFERVVRAFLDEVLTGDSVHTP